MPVSELRPRVRAIVVIAGPPGERDARAGDRPRTNTASARSSGDSVCPDHSTQQTSRVAEAMRSGRVPPHANNRPIRPQVFALQRSVPAPVDAFPRRRSTEPTPQLRQKIARRARAIAGAGLSTFRHRALVPRFGSPPNLPQCRANLGFSSLAFNGKFFANQSRHAAAGSALSDGFCRRRSAALANP
jgi:hypothetical protein